MVQIMHKKNNQATKDNKMLQITKKTQVLQITPKKETYRKQTNKQKKLAENRSF